MSRKIHKILFATAASLIAGTAMASDGKIVFTGSITAASCDLSQGNGADVSGAPGNQIINVDLGTVSADSVTQSTTNANIAAGKAINLKLDCTSSTGLTKVKLSFEPMGGSGVDPANNSLLKTTGTATGVGIGIYTTAGTLLNLGANQTFDATLSVDAGGVGTAALALRAGYVKSGTAAIGAGSANGELPFTLTYQ